MKFSIADIRTRLGRPILPGDFQFLNNGFTLTEFLAVAGIIAFLSLLVIPTFRMFQPVLQLSGSTQELVDDFHYIQQLTITEQKEYCLQFFPADKKYQLKECEGEIIGEKIFPAEIESVSVSGFTDDEVRYNPYGAVKEAGTIILENSKNSTKTVSVKPSGFIKVTD
jgi:prepilin-type N-terminal cleavage/methylation domain-containing protein